MSSESESDEDYVPDKPEQLSEEESDHDGTEALDEKERQRKANKRQSLETKQNGKKRKISNRQVQTRSNPTPEYDNDEEITDPQPVDPETAKKKEDDLWASFLEGTDTPKPNILTKAQTNKQVEAAAATGTKKFIPKNKKDPKEEVMNKEARIFEFAGEKVVVEDNVIKEVVKATPSSSPATSKSPVAAVLGRPVGGLSGLLGQLNKKNKLSTLEKTKLDWETFKKKEGIEEELQTFNKGKDGYLERQDFLERADLRQFELERDLRTSRRNNQ